MPIVTLTVRGPKPAEFTADILDAIHQSLVMIGAHPDDRFHRVIVLDEDHFQFHPTFPDVRGRRTEDFLLVEVVLGVGRSVKLKRQMLANLAERLTGLGHDPENLMVVFQDVAWENFSPAGGRQPHV